MISRELDSGSPDLADATGGADLLDQKMPASVVSTRQDMKRTRNLGWAVILRWPVLDRGNLGRVLVVGGVTHHMPLASGQPPWSVQLDIDDESPLGAADTNLQHGLSQFLDLSASSMALLKYFSILSNSHSSPCLYVL
jgi:hypothetical protein